MSNCFAFLCETTDHHRCTSGVKGVIRPCLCHDLVAPGLLNISMNMSWSGCKSLASTPSTRAHPSPVRHILDISIDARSLYTIHYKHHTHYTHYTHYTLYTCTCTYTYAYTYTYTYAYIDVCPFTYTFFFEISTAAKEMQRSLHKK